MRQNPSDQTKKEGHIRKLEARDRSRIEEIVISSGNFNEAEIATALELVDQALEEGEKSGYMVVVLEYGKDPPTVRGYASYGPTPLTDGVYDLYWIVVDPATQGTGLGRLLLEYVERDVLRRGGRMILIETSSKENYAPTIRFYKRRGYEQVARIKNFYRLGDDKLIFSKEFT